MKKTVFLLCLMLLTIPVKEVSSYGNNETYHFEDYDLIISDYTENGNRGISIEKTGTNPFYTIIEDENETYIINGVIKTEFYYVIYGCNHILDNETYYDSMFIVMDMLGNIVEQTTYNFGDLDEVVGAYLLDNILILHTVQSTDDGTGYVFVTNYFSTYDLSFAKTDTIEITNQIKQIANNEDYILLNFEYDDDYDIAIRDDLSLLLADDFINLSNNTEFNDEVTIEFLNEALLNNEIVENGITIDYPGNYQLFYNNAEYNFVVNPIINGFEDNKTYNEAVTPFISSGNIMLNNDLFISGTEITLPGNYELIINGVNGYIKTYNFTITSDLKGITNNHTYFEPVIVTFNGEGYLNNQFVESPLELTEDGEYLLKIKGENNYLETYYFQIDQEEEAMTLLGFIQKFDIFILVVVLVSGGIILKKK